MASTYLQRTPSGGDRRKMTFSAWVKRCGVGQHNVIMSFGNGGERGMILFESSDKLQFSQYVSGYNFQLGTNRLFRDPNGWYHIVCVLDTAQATASNRAKIYVNGVQETSLANSSYPSQNYETYFNLNGTTCYIGQDSDGSADYNGAMSHVHYCDGYAYTPSDFGSTDATTGEWKINTSPSVSYGTNGFFMFKDDNSLSDDSGQGNNFTLGAGTLTKTEDCPSNVFCTMNPLDKYATSLTNGNTTVANENNNSTGVMSTLAVNSGKWYWEAKVGDSATDTFNVGVRKTGQNNYGVTGFPYSANGWVYAVDGNIYHNGSTLLNTGTTCTVGDIIGFILDMDAGTLKLKKNGSDIYSGNAVITGLNTGEHFHVVQGSSQALVYFNFGNGYFGTTQVSSAGTNASGNGIFEYDVPANHTAISTKGYNL